MSRVLSCTVLVVVSFSPTSGSTLTYTGAFRPGWTPGLKSMWLTIWLTTPASGWWGMNKKVCCPAPPPATLRSSIIYTLASIGWRTEHCSPSSQMRDCHSFYTRSCRGWLHINSSFMRIFPACCYWIQLPKSFLGLLIHILMGCKIFHSQIQELCLNFQVFTTNTALYEK